MQCHVRDDYSPSILTDLMKRYNKDEVRNQTPTNLRLEIKVEASLESVEVKFAGGEEVCPGLLSGLVVVVLHIVVVVVVVEA